MTTFRVDPEALRTFAKGLDTLAETSSRATSYAGHTDMTVSGSSASALVRLVQAAHGVAPTVEGVFRQLERLASASADEVVRAARYYEQTEAAAAAAYERTQLGIPAFSDRSLRGKPI